MSRLGVTIATIAVVMVAISILWPVTVQATGSSSNGSKVKLSGFLHFAFETPACVTQHLSCGLTSVEVTYMTALDGNNYMLLGVGSAYMDNTKVVVTGWLKAPSAFSGGALSPALTFAGTISVTNLLAHCEKHLGQ